MFHRRAYWLIDNPNIVIVHYLNSSERGAVRKRKKNAQVRKLNEFGNPRSPVSEKDDFSASSHFCSLDLTSVTAETSKSCVNISPPANRTHPFITSAQVRDLNSNVMNYSFSASDCSSVPENPRSYFNSDELASYVTPSHEEFLNCSIPSMYHGNSGTPFQIPCDLSVSANTFHGFPSEESTMDSFPNAQPRSSFSSPRKNSFLDDESVFFPLDTANLIEVLPSNSLLSGPLAQFGQLTLPNTNVKNSPLLNSSAFDSDQSNQLHTSNPLRNEISSQLPNTSSTFTPLPCPDSVITTGADDFSTPPLNPSKLISKNQCGGTITEYCPNWSFSEGGCKVLLTGPFCSGQRYKCIFGDEGVDGIVIAEGVLKCVTPASKNGCVPLYVVDQDEQPVTNAVEFEFKETLPSASTWLKIADEKIFKIKLLKSLEKLELFVKALNEGGCLKSCTNDTKGYGESNFILPHYETLLQNMTSFEEVTVNFCENLLCCLREHVELLYSQVIESQPNEPDRFDTPVSALPYSQTSGKNAFAQMGINLAIMQKAFKEPQTSLTLLHYACGLGYSRIVAVVASWISRIKDSYDDSVAFLTSNFYGPAGCSEKNNESLGAMKTMQMKKGVYELLKRCIDIVCTDKCMCTPLMWACANDRLNAVQVLLAYDEDDLPSLQIRDQWARLPLDVAYDNGHFELVNAIQDQLNIWNSEAIHDDAEAMELGSAQSPNENDASVIVCEDKANVSVVNDDALSENEIALVNEDSVSSVFSKKTFESISPIKPLPPVSPKDDYENRKGSDLDDIFATAGYNALEKNFGELTLKDGDPFIIFKSARIIQKAFRKYKNGQKYSSESLNAAVLIQRAYKGYQSKKLKQGAAQRIQAQFRVYRNTVKFNETQQAAQKIQRKFRFHKSRTSVKKRLEAARKIQKYMRALL